MSILILHLNMFIDKNFNSQNIYGGNAHEKKFF